MVLRTLQSFFIVLLLAFCNPALSLTIYRIGGEGLEPPTLDAAYEFVQLSWNEVDPNLHGSEGALEISPDFLRPQKLNPEVNLLPIVEGKGGKIFNHTWIGWGLAAHDDFFMFDEDPDTIYLGDGHFAAHGPKSKSLRIDFASRLLLDRIRFFPREKHHNDRYVQSFRIGFNDGDPLKDGTREYKIGRTYDFVDFDIVHEVQENTEAVIDLKLPSTPVKRLLFQADENTRGIWEVAELEIYGKGFVPFSYYITNVIDLGAPASLGQLSWLAHKDEGAGIELSMRSGVDSDPNTYWRSTFRGGERTRFDANGRLLSLKSYNKLQRGEQAGISHDTEHWAFWGAAYDFSAGAGEMVGAGPRQFVQIRADFTSDQQASAQLDYFQFAVSIPPVASGAVAEIVPVAARPGEVTPFSYKLRPNIKSDDLGFDSIEIDTPSQATSVDEVRISGQSVAFELVSLDQEGFVINIPRIDAQRTEELIEVDFQAEVFKFGTVFAGRVFDSKQPLEVPQNIAAGDADANHDSDKLSVDLSRFGERTIRKLTLTPSAFSPNDDGINDVVYIEYDLLNLVGGVPVRAEVYDLSGRLIAMIFDKEEASGRFVTTWDGRDAKGEKLAPGLYIFKLSVDADKGEDVRQFVVSLVY